MSGSKGNKWTKERLYGGEYSSLITGLSISGSLGIGHMPLVSSSEPCLREAHEIMYHNLSLTENYSNTSQTRKQ